MSLAREGVDLVIIARTKDVLEATAEEIRVATGVSVTAIAADITKDEGREAALAACPSPDIIVNNAGGPPVGDFRDWDREDWIKGFRTSLERLEAVLGTEINERRQGEDKLTEILRQQQIQTTELMEFVTKFNKKTLLAAQWVVGITAGVVLTAIITSAVVAAIKFFSG